MRHINVIFPGFEIIQDDDFFKLSQDTVLLSEFAHLRKGEKGLDLGCGVGCLGILAMLKNPGSVDGVELIPGAAALAEENYRRCSLQGRGEVICADFCSLPTNMFQQYDVCLSNPPYFAQNGGKVSPSPSMAAARCDKAGDAADACRAAAKCLKTGGRLYICYPPSRLPYLLLSMEQCGIAPKRLRLVHQSFTSGANLVLVEGRKGGGEGLSVMPPLIICNADGSRTEEYNAIYRR